MCDFYFTPCGLDLGYAEIICDQTMLILAFESSCDDTSVALLSNADLICMKTHTQNEHKKTS